MKHPIGSRFGLAVLVSASLVSSASAVVSIDYVSVGYAGNAAGSTGYGSVAYEYKIAKNETTIGQYAEFLNAKAKSDPYALCGCVPHTARGGRDQPRMKPRQAPVLGSNYLHAIRRDA